MNHPKLLISLLLISSGACANPIVWSAGNGHSYEIVSLEGSISWQAARDAAAAKGGYLVSLTTIAENDFVAGLIAAAPHLLDAYWLGGYQTDPNGPGEPNGSWAWVSGEIWDSAFADDRWAPNEPNNGVSGSQHFLHFWPSLPLWDDMENRNTMRGYVVEYAAVPEPGTLALFGVGLIALGITRRQKKHGNR